MRMTFIIFTIIHLIIFQFFLNLEFLSAFDYLNTDKILTELLVLKEFKGYLFKEELDIEIKDFF